MRWRWRRPRLATACSTSRAGTGDLTRALAQRVGPDRLRGAHRHQRRHARGRPRPPGRPGPEPAHCAVRCRSAAVRRRQLRPRHGGFRPAQHDAQGARARRDGAGAARSAGGWWCWSSRAWPSRCASPTTGTRSRCCRVWAAGWPAMAKAIATWRSRSACTRRRPSSRR